MARIGTLAIIALALRLRTRLNFTCAYNSDDWTKAYKTYSGRGRRRFLNLLYAAVGTLMLLFGFVVATTAKNHLSDGLPLFLLGIFWFYMAHGMWLNLGRRMFKGRPELQQQFAVSVDDNRVVFVGPISCSEWSWPAFVGFVEGKSNFLLLLSPFAFVVFPKRIFSSQQVEQFRELLRQKLPAR